MIKRAIKALAYLCIFELFRASLILFCGADNPAVLQISGDGVMISYAIIYAAGLLTKE